MRALLADNGTFYYNIQGFAEGTTYNIVYQDDADRDFQPEITSLLADFEKSLSVYDSTSIISRVNNNEEIEVDNFFTSVFNRAKEISLLTDGAFDMSAEPLFRAWGFSFKEKSVPDTGEVNILKERIGMDKVSLENGRVIKTNSEVVLNANAIAKGFSADIVAHFLDDHGIINYLIEIGGEIRLKGLNLQGGVWRIGIDRPAESNPIPGQDLQAVLHITDRGIATSGNYRQFYIQDGKKISHTIDPRTGYPVAHNLLSVTVVAPDAMTADAFATAFMVEGIDIAIQRLQQFPELSAIFICDEEGEYKMYCSESIRDCIIEE